MVVTTLNYILLNEGSELRYEEKSCKKEDYASRRLHTRWAHATEDSSRMMSQSDQRMRPQQQSPDCPPVRSLSGVIGVCSKPLEKQLTPTDVRTDQCRLPFNKADVENFLSPLLNKSDDLVRGTPVTVHDMNGKECPMTFKLWASKFHVLTEGWNKFCKDELRKYEDLLRCGCSAMFRRENFALSSP
ncbi:hypothetical protein CIPAW_03G015100 [Carya illinoinensis]|uniref:TF-B3 domain-containing protein n=1 Tax=Carya illinoinensis TaxID=32201 RepID=A0A8T1QXL4_CARIL|nr:hypothetical protein CIPAW_03G015100 [Carya illinoinensis]